MGGEGGGRPTVKDCDDCKFVFFSLREELCKSCEVEMERVEVSTKWEARCRE